MFTTYVTGVLKGPAMHLRCYPLFALFLLYTLFPRLREVSANPGQNEGNTLASRPFVSSSFGRNASIYIKQVVHPSASRSISIYLVLTERIVCSTSKLGISECCIRFPAMLNV